MKLSLDNIGKRFKFHWIFRQVSLDIQKGETLSIKGPNGSGKSTLLKVISGFLSPSEGKVVFEKEGALIKDYYKHVSYAAPYVDLVDQMTLREHLIFHQKFKSFKQSLTTEQVIEILQLSKSADKHIKDYSSGMQQRLRLGLAVLSEGDLCILDEPTTNLDVEGFQWYADLLSKFQEDTAMVIASNEERDFVNGGAVLNIRDYK